MVGFDITESTSRRVDESPGAATIVSRVVVARLVTKVGNCHFTPDPHFDTSSVNVAIFKQRSTDFLVFTTA